MTCKAFIKHFRLMSRFGSSWSGLLEDNRLVTKMWSSEDFIDIQTNYERKVYQNHLKSTRNLCLHKLIVEKKTLLKETQIKHKHQNSQTSSIKPQLDKYLLNTHNISYETNIVTYMHCHHHSIIENVLKPSSKSSIWCVFFSLFSNQNININAKEHLLCCVTSINIDFFLLHETTTKRLHFKNR